MSVVDEQSFWLGDWKVEPILNRIVREDKSAKLNPQDMNVLKVLASKPGHVFSQAEIERAVWPNVCVTSNSIYQSIAQLRRELGDHASNPRYIKTIPRRGYQLVAEVRYRADDPACTTNRNDLSAIKQTLREWLPRIVLLAAICSAVLGATMLQPSKGTHKEAHRPLRTADQTLEKLPENAQFAPQILHQLAAVAIAEGRLRDAREHLLDAIEIERERVGDKHPNVGELLGALANVYVFESDHTAAESAARAALAAYEHTSELRPDRVLAISQLGYVLLESGNLSAAEPRMLEALGLASRVFGIRSLTRSRILDHVAVLRFSQARLHEAEQAAREALEIAIEAGADAQAISRQRVNLGRILIAQSRFEEARHQAIEAAALLADAKESHPLAISAQDLLARTLMGTGNHTAAEALLRKNIQLWQQNDRWPQRTWASASTLGECLLAQGRIEEAEEYLARASLNLGKSTALQEQLWFQEHLERLHKLHLAKVESKEVIEQTLSGS